MIYGTPLALSSIQLGEFMKTVQTKWFQIGLAVLALGALVGCGSSKSNSDGFGAVDSSSTSTPSSSVAQAVCSQDVAGQSDLQVRLMQFVDSYSQTRSDYVRLQFRIAPAEWQTSNWDMLIYRWTAAPDNSTSMDSTPLYYQFEKKVPAGFQLLHSQSYQVMNWSEIQSYAQAVNVNAATPQDFFMTASLLVNLKDMTNSYQVLRVVFRDKTTGAVAKSADVLIPSFLADPAKYNADSRHPITLQVLHPLKDKLGQSWTQANYYEFARAFCF